MSIRARRLTKLVSALLVAFLMLTSELSAAGAASILASTWSTSSTTLGASGSTYNYNFTTGSAATLAKEDFSVPAGTDGASGSRYLALNGGSNNYASAPGSVGNATTTLDVRVQLSTPNWYTSTVRGLVAKRNGGASSWSLVLDGLNGLELSQYDGSSWSYGYQLLPTGWAANSVHWLRATKSPTGTSSYYYGTDGINWTFIGTSGGKSTLASNTTSPLAIGAMSDGSGVTLGKFYYADVRSSINGTTSDASSCTQPGVIACFNPNTPTTSSASTWTSSDSNAEPWTVNRSGVTNDPADIASDLSVNSVTGIPSGGTASIRLIDGVIEYVHTATAVSAGTKSTFSVSGLTNTSVAGAYRSTITTLDNSGTPVVKDTNSTNNAVAFGTQAGSPSWAVSTSVSGAIATDTFAVTASKTATLDRASYTVPAGTTTVGSNYLHLPGSSLNFFSTPSSTANQITTNIDIRAKVAPTTWASGGNQTIIGKWGGSYWFGLYADGSPQLCWSPSGGSTCVNATSTTGLANGTAVWLRGTLLLNNGSSGNTVTFYTSTDGTNWTQLGSPVVSSGTTAIQSSSAQVYVGQNGANASLFSGDVYYADIRNAISSPTSSASTCTQTGVAVCFDPTSATTAPYNSWTSSSTNAEVWTMARSGAVDQVEIDRPLTVSTVTGLPAGGSAVLDINDNTVNYRFANASITSGTPMSLVISNLTNTSIIGTYPCYVTTFDSTGAAVDAATTNTVIIGPLSPAFTRDKAAIGAIGATYGLSATTQGTNIVRYLDTTVPTGTTSGSSRYLYVPASNNNYASTPNSVANSLTGVVDVRVKASLDNWYYTGSTQGLAAKRIGSTTTSLSWSLYLTTTGNIELAQGDGSAVVYPYAALPTGWAAGSTHWIRAVSGATTAFYWSNDGVAWTSITPTNSTGKASLAALNIPIAVGASSGGSGPAIGKINYAEIRNGNAGPISFKFDPTNDATSNTPTSWTSSSSSAEVWTVNRSGASGPTSDIASDVTVASYSGLGAGTAQLRYIDHAIRYTPTSAVSVTGNTPVALSYSGITNTPTQGSFTPNISTYDNSATPSVIDTGAANSVYFTTPPTAVADSATVNQDSSVVVDVLANDSDPDDSLVPSSETIATAPAHGGTSINSANGKVTYTPTAGYYGSDSFVYSICDTYSACSTATVSITVLPNYLTSASWMVAPGAVGHTNLREQFTALPKLNVVSMQLAFVMPTGFASTSPTLVSTYGIAGTVTASVSGTTLTIVYPSQTLLAGVPIGFAIEGITNGGSAGTYTSAVSLYNTDASSIVGWATTGSVVLTANGAPATGTAGYASVWNRSLIQTLSGPATINVNTLGTADVTSAIALTNGGNLNLNGLSLSGSSLVNGTKTISPVTSSLSTNVSSSSFTAGAWGVQVVGSSATNLLATGSGLYTGLNTTSTGVLNAAAANNVTTLTFRTKVDFKVAAGTYVSTITWSNTPGS